MRGLVSKLLRQLIQLLTGFAACWSAVLVFDFLVFLLTAVRAFRVWQSGVIVRVVLRDGVLYFWYVCSDVNEVNH